MRIPVGSCEGCNADAPLKSGGVHAMGAGRYVRCAFIDAELMHGFGNGKTPELLGAYRSRVAAVRKARQHNGGILWIGQAPISIYLAVR